MLNADDPSTFPAVRRLQSIAAAGDRPIILWVGAGAGRWLGYASWENLARQLRKEFFQQHLPGFNNDGAMALIDKKEFPALFQMCRDLDAAIYYRFIVDSFAPRQQTPVYADFVRLLGKIDPLFIVTTNVDEMLEKSLPLTETVQRTDLDRCVELLHTRRPFVAKLHGSISAVQRTVFATEDYQSLVGNRSTLTS
ncbi:MAG: SIR2 family protein [Candidatus Sulfotelmatobacter sp.]